MNPATLKDRWPLATQFRHQSMCYKQGHLGFLYVWMNGRWVRSSKDAKDFAGKRNYHGRVIQ